MSKTISRSMLVGLLLPAMILSMVAISAGVYLVGLMRHEQQLMRTVAVTMDAARFNSRTAALADVMRTDIYRAVHAIHAGADPRQPLAEIERNNALFAKRIAVMADYPLPAAFLGDIGRAQTQFVSFQQRVGRILDSLKQGQSSDEMLADLEGRYTDLHAAKMVALNHLAARERSLHTETTALADNIIRVFVGGRFMVLLFFIALVVIVNIRLIRPVRRIAQELAGESEEGSIRYYATYKGEIGVLASTLARQRVKANEHERLEVAERKRLQERADRQLRTAQAVERLQGAVGSMLDSVASEMQRMLFAADQLGKIAADAKRESHAAANASGMATTLLSSVLQTTEELSITARDVGRQIGQITDAVGQANALSVRANDDIASLSSTTSLIGNVIDLIKGIAEQTNLLALNATIEAARAGEAGRGFAVVANEVKALANQTAAATEEIARHIVSVQASTASTVGQTREIAGAIAALQQAAANIGAAVEQQSTANNQIVRDMSAVSATARDLAGSVGEVSETIGATSDAAEAMRDIATGIDRQSQALRGSIENFLKEVAA